MTERDLAMLAASVADRGAAWSAEVAGRGTAWPTEAAGRGAAWPAEAAGRGAAWPAENDGGPRQALPPDPDRVSRVVREIRGGGDPLGAAFCRIRSPEVRRRQGAVYTPPPIVQAMVAWAAAEGEPARVVDPGAGSGRFLLAAGRTFPRAALIAVESDPLAALTLRANAAALGMADRVTVLTADYRAIDLSDIDGPTLFVGNPPYVRHHDIPPDWKDWLVDAAAACGLKASRLAGLHVHFFLKTCRLARPGDYGAFITSAEWLDVNYGDVLRKAFIDPLGGMALHVMTPTAMPFPGTDVTGAVACFRIGRASNGVRLRSVETRADLNALQGGRTVERATLAAARRWSPLLRPARHAPRGHVELGELCRVHRGQVTGCNAVWIAGGYPGRLPGELLFPAVTRARELFDAATRRLRTDALRRVIDLPVELDRLDDDAAAQVERFLHWARHKGADASYVARNRRAWWAVGLRKPAPLLCTYMARRPPAFVRNPHGARHLNIAHGLYPRETLSDAAIDALAAWLQRHACVSAGRTYAGGLTKFEPGEIERLRIPPLERLNELSEDLDESGSGTPLERLNEL